MYLKKESKKKEKGNEKGPKKEETEDTTKILRDHKVISCSYEVVWFHHFCLMGGTET